MDIQRITYRGRVVAAATADEFFLSEQLRGRPFGDPERTFVLLMAAYAAGVLRGELPGSYTEERACRFARGTLVPEELLERRDVNVPRAARALGIPAAELQRARRELQAREIGAVPP